MGAWSVAILDDGVTNATEALYGRNKYEYSFYYNEANTDLGRSTSHGSVVTKSIEVTNSSLERIDLQMASDDMAHYSILAADRAMDHLIAMHDVGWKIGAMNLSWGGTSPPNTLKPEIAALADRGIFGVAASGNDGSHSATEMPIYPARFDNVISVGSHDGLGNPTSFSQNWSGGVHVLADGENFPGPGQYGTSYAAPQVAAGVTTVQALADTTLERRLTFDEVVDVLQQGGAADLSAPDPASAVTRYHLFDFNDSVNYFTEKYLDPNFSAREYMASYSDIETVFGDDLNGAWSHLINTGVYEGRKVDFDGMEYIASHKDLIRAFGANREAGAAHFLTSGRGEGRSTTFDGADYLASHADLRAAFGTDGAAASKHYINNGFSEGRATTPSVSERQSGTAWGEMPANTSTQGLLGVNGSVTGQVNSKYDQDWYKITLSKGQTFTFDLEGTENIPNFLSGTLRDPIVRLFNGSGQYVAADNNGGLGLDSKLVYTASTSGNYFVSAGGWYTATSSSTGNYTLTATSGNNSLSAASSSQTADSGMLKIVGDGLEFVIGGAGDDVLNGSQANDFYVGGAGADQFKFSPGKDTVADFNFAEGDRISGIKLTQVTVTDSQEGAVLSDSVNTLILKNFTAAQVDADWFL
jgi:hypothetical protein